MEKNVKSVVDDVVENNYEMKEMNYLSVLQSIWGLRTPEEAAKILTTKILKNTSYDIRADVTDENKTTPYLFPEVMEILGHVFGSLVVEYKGDHDIEAKMISLKLGEYLVSGYDTGKTSVALTEAWNKGLVKAGINVYNIGLASSGQVYYNQMDFKAHGHSQTTGSHTEKWINGIKFAIGLQGFHTKILGQMAQFVLQNKPLRVANVPGNIIDVSDEGYKVYANRMKAIYRRDLNQNNLPIAFNAFYGTGTKYVELTKDLFGKTLVKIFAKDANPDPNIDGMMIVADPTRKEMLEKMGIIEYSKNNPEVIVFSVDRDADRIAVVQNGNLYLGDELGFILSKYKLTVANKNFLKRLESLGRLNTDNRKEVMDIIRTVYTDNRCTRSLDTFIEKLGGIAEPHIKGHSLWKETMNANIARLAELTGFSSVAEFVQYTSYRDYQMEYSLHMFVSGTEDGVPRDCGVEGMYVLTKIFNELKMANLDDFFVNETEYKTMYSTKEIRTGVNDNTKELFTRVINDVIKNLFGVLGGKFSIHDDFYPGQVRVNFPEGFFMYSCSNTSAKVTPKIEGNSIELRNQLLVLLMTIHNYLKNPEEKMDLKENSFYVNDATYEMNDPDNVDAFDVRLAQACAFFGVSPEALKRELVRAKEELDKAKKELLAPVVNK